MKKMIIKNKLVEPGEPEGAPVKVKEKKVIQPLSVDYPSEGLNDMARKINEIIERDNG